MGRPRKYDGDDAIQSKRIANRISQAKYRDKLRALNPRWTKGSNVDRKTNSDLSWEPRILMHGENYDCPTAIDYKGV